MTAAQDPTWAELESVAIAPKRAANPPISNAKPATHLAGSQKVIPALAEKWRRGDDAAAGDETRVEWVLRDYLARGTITELDGKVKVSGKTTFCHHLARAILDGEPFLSRSTLQGPVVYLTEEGPATFQRAMAARGLKGKSDFHYLSKRHAATATWPQLVAAAREKVIEVGAVILFVDTLGKLAGFLGDDENSAGRVMAAMLPLQALATELNIAIVVTRHERRAGGQVGESARGSTAISGDVDQILQLTRTGGDSHQNERWLKAIGRYDETPAELRIELDRGGYRVVGPDDALNRAGEALLDMLQPDEPAAIADLLEDLAEQGHSRKAVYESAARLIESGQLGEIEVLGKTGHRRKAIVSRSSGGPNRQCPDLGAFDLSRGPVAPSESIVSRTSNARDDLLTDLSFEDPMASSSGGLTSAMDCLALPHPSLEGGDGQAGATRDDRSTSVPAGILRLFPGAKVAEPDQQGAS